MRYFPLNFLLSGLSKFTINSLFGVNKFNNAWCVLNEIKLLSPSSVNWGAPSITCDVKACFSIATTLYFSSVLIYIPEKLARASENSATEIICVALYSLFLQA